MGLAKGRVTECKVNVTDNFRNDTERNETGDHRSQHRRAAGRRPPGGAFGEGGCGLWSGRVPLQLHKQHLRHLASNSVHRLVRFLGAGNPGAL